MLKHCREEVTRLRLLQLPGFGVVTAVIVWAAIGDVQRFEDAQHLVGGLYGFGNPGPR
jgi:transposase